MILKKFFNWYLIFYIISNWYNLFQNCYLKPSWTLRGEFHWGGVLFKSKEKHLKQGEKISNLENASRNLIHIPLTICKKTLKRISKRICKNKTSGEKVVQILKERKHPCISNESINWFKFQATFALTLCKLVQFCTYIFALVCVGICRGP
jgi:hypothetical protein